jgi:hypothetical protein
VRIQKPCDVFEENDFGTPHCNQIVEYMEKSRPFTLQAVSPKPPTGNRNILARESSGPYFSYGQMISINGFNVRSFWSRGPMAFQHTATKWVYFAMKADLYASTRESKIESSDPREEGV